MSGDNKWKKPSAPPPPMFFGKKERDLVKQVNDEVAERVVGQQILYFGIDYDNTEFHPLYGEAIEKTFYPPVRVYAMVEFQSIETNFLENLSLDKSTKIKIMFHKRRLTEDQELFVREGDFVKYGEVFYEIVKLIEPKLLFGQVEHRFEIHAECIRARDGLFNGE